MSLGGGVRGWAWLLWAALLAPLSSCQGQRAAVHLSLARASETPRDASVYIDEQFVGFLGVVVARGVRLPEGEHRITVQKVGYFPWDRLVVSDRQPIALQVELRKIPE
jgi:PEGA domain